MKHNLTPTLSRPGGYLAQLERQHAPSTYTQPFQEALGALERLRALQEEAHKAKGPIRTRRQAKRIEAENRPGGLHLV